MFNETRQVSLCQVCLVDDQRFNGRGIDGGAKFLGVVRQYNVQQILDFLLFKRGETRGLLLYIMHAQDDMPNHPVSHSGWPS